MRCNDGNQYSRGADLVFKGCGFDGYIHQTSNNLHTHLIAVACQESYLRSTEGSARCILRYEKSKYGAVTLFKEIIKQSNLPKLKF